MLCYRMVLVILIDTWIVSQRNNKRLDLSTHTHIHTQHHHQFTKSLILSVSFESPLSLSFHFSHFGFSVLPFYVILMRYGISGMNIVCTIHNKGVLRISIAQEFAQ